MKKTKKRDVILVPRSIVNQAWYREKNAFIVYLHLLFIGDGLCNIQVLADDTGLTYQQILTALKCLETEGIITILRRGQGLHITVHEVR